MPRLIVTEGATSGLERCRQFLKEKNSLAMIRAASVIEQHFSLLESDPEIGRLFDDLSELRELIIPFGNSGYITLYRFEKSDDAVYILAFRHQKEAGY
ncbi:MAG: type II toxin-antitoxin system RelE/ParE family toxin [Pseudomonadota bacterium]